MSWRRILHGLIRLYPTPWRIRYGREFETLIDDLLADPQESGWHLAWGMAWGAVKERAHPEVRPDPRAAPGTDAYRVTFAMRQEALRLPLMQHRDLLFRRGLAPGVTSTLEPGEEVVGSFDTYTAWPLAVRANRRSPLMMVYGLVWVPWILIGGTLRTAGLWVLATYAAFWMVERGHLLCHRGSPEDVLSHHSGTDRIRTRLVLPPEGTEFTVSSRSAGGGA